MGRPREKSPKQYAPRRPVELGERFVHLEVVGFEPGTRRRRGRQARCRCHCGEPGCAGEVLVRASSLRAGATVSCGTTRSANGKKQVRLAHLAAAERHEERMVERFERASRAVKVAEERRDKWAIRLREAGSRVLRLRAQVRAVT